MATGFPSRNRHQNVNVHFYHQLAMFTHGVRRAGSAALDLAYVACGRLDAFWEFGLNPWDVAAGVLLVREAGGQVSDMRGSRFPSAGRTSWPTTAWYTRACWACFERYSPAMRGWRCPR